MGETGFIHKKNSYKVVVLEVSRKVWSKCADANFHITFVVCVSPDKYVAPPLLILPVKRFNRDVLKGFDIEGANITTARKVLINSTFFKAVLNYFQTLFLIQLHAHLSWFMMAVAAITMVRL